MKIIKQFIINAIIAISLISCVGLLAAPSALAADGSTDLARNAACDGIKVAGGSCTGSAAGKSLNKIIKATLNLLSIIAGVVAVVMIVIAGLKYISSGGEAQAVAGAKRTLIYAIVGMVVVAFSQIIVFYVLGNDVTG